jgi:hypothetical protein
MPSNLTFSRINCTHHKICIFDSRLNALLSRCLAFSIKVNLHTKVNVIMAPIKYRIEINTYTHNIYVLRTETNVQLYVNKLEAKLHTSINRF